MTDLLVTIRPADGVTVPAAMPPRTVEATYSRDVGAPAEEDPNTPGIVQETVRAALGADAKAGIALPSVAPDTPIVLRFLSGTGSTRLERTLPAPGAAEVTVELTGAEVKALAESELTAEIPEATVSRQGKLVPVTTVSVDFASAQFRVVVIDPGDWSNLALDAVLGGDGVRTSSAETRPDQIASIAGLEWTPVHIGVDGAFVLTTPKAPGKAWLWWLAAGSQVAIGAVNDDLGKPRLETMALPLPPFEARAIEPGAAPGRVPIDITEDELADNPGVFTEDPGAFCRPFSNPERILGERALHVILRAEQPSISSEPTRRSPTFPLLDFDPVVADPEPGGRDTGGGTGRGGTILRALGAADRQPRIALADGVARGIELARPRLPLPYLDLLDRAPSGRGELGPTNPLDWEGDATRYQAATVARGHILEFRLRWRSNGYSLGTVAKTLTLAPRQVKRIQKIEWERLERTRREERTQLVDEVADEVSRDRTYQDSVEASLSEWARGESRSSTSAGAGGFGFAGPGFVIGGGGGHSRSQSSSSQSGGRETRAAEEQRLRDTVRRFADSLRRMESVVVTEVSQEETVTGTTEIVRNANYAHSLTVIYYQILRHLKLETAFAAVRECLFVPFAIKPFTVARAYRWRESIRSGLRDRQYAAALNHLRDVMTGFAGSAIPPGMRANQRVRYIRGSMTVSLGVERPLDGAEGAFDDAAWRVLRPFLGVPAVGIYSRLRQVVEAQRDRLFQQEDASRIAARWANSLTLSASGAALRADFTLATRYQFNGPVRIDFTVLVPPGQVVTRHMLSTIAVRASLPLTPGSVANLTSLSYTYDTDTFRRSVSVPLSTGDLITVDTGAVDPGGATAFQGPDAWELQDERAEMIKAVQALIGHLNEHVEHYHKVIWWAMDRDRMFMLADGAYIPGTSGVSVASVIERDPIAIIGNSLVFRVAAGAFLGIDGLTTPDALHGWYADRQGKAVPMHVALPTDGLYAQTIMDECVALEEHYGDLDWVLNDKEPELGAIDPSLLMSRRAEPAGTTPTPFPQTIINLQNAPEAPAPTGLAGAMQAVTNANAFRDMAGLAGTQANAAAGFQTAASLATTFGQQAAALKLADIAARSQATKEANQKLGSIKKAKAEELVTPEKATKEAEKVLEGLSSPTTMPPFKDMVLADVIKAAKGTPGSEVTATPDGLKVSLASFNPAGLPLVAFANPLGPVLTTVDTIREWMRKVEVFKREAARIAQDENTTWNGRPESDAAVLPFLEAYGRAGNATNPAAWAAGAAADTTPWSAGFISFVVEQALLAAGIQGDPFGRSTLHSDYLAAAKANRVNRNFANPFWLYRLGEVKPELGDFLCKNRVGSNAVTFENIAAGQLSHVDIVTSVTDAQLLATGGNRGGQGLTVVEAAVARTDGLVDAGSLAAGPYFAILRVRTNPLEGITLP